ncbi:MAG: type I-E CRISPR-associated protein Cas6/Cse3/CasE [bacterium]
MSADLLLSKVTLRRDAPIAALRDVFVPDEETRRTTVGHQLMWTLFGDAPDRTRDFLWREAGDGRFYVLSRREPLDRHDLFHIDPPKPFVPKLAAGDRLRFSLRANATVARRVDGMKRGKPVDVVMDALYNIPKGEARALARADAVQAAGLQWLARLGERAGYSIAINTADSGTWTARVASHRVLTLDHRQSEMTIGVLDFEGELEVVDPVALLTSIAAGLGRAKAFGCGLMLIRRAPGA